ncbi:MAG: hypothetical protein M1821_004213 [Bathelium mastoideum]|nr:MAG: hypothetical protein M1821_004213 [Bathelium mastoideum]
MDGSKAAIKGKDVFMGFSTKDPNLVYWDQDEQDFFNLARRLARQPSGTQPFSDQPSPPPSQSLVAEERQSEERFWEPPWMPARDPTPLRQTRDNAILLGQTRDDPIPMRENRDDPITVGKSSYDPIAMVDSNYDPITALGESIYDPITAGESRNDPIPVGESRDDPVPLGESRDDPIPLGEHRDEMMLAHIMEFGFTEPVNEQFINEYQITDRDSYKDDAMEFSFEELPDQEFHAEVNDFFGDSIYGHGQHLETLADDQSVARLHDEDTTKEQNNNRSANLDQEPRVVKPMEVFAGYHSTRDSQLPPPQLSIAPASLPSTREDPSIADTTDAFREFTKSSSPPSQKSRASTPSTSAIEAHPVSTSQIANTNTESGDTDRPPQSSHEPGLVWEKSEFGVWHKTWQIERIINSRRDSNSELWYRVKWAGSDAPEYTTWEPYESVADCATFLADFHALNPTKPFRKLHHPSFPSHFKRPEGWSHPNRSG